MPPEIDSRPGGGTNDAKASNIAKHKKTRGQASGIPNRLAYQNLSATIRITRAKHRWTLGYTSSPVHRLCVELGLQANNYKMITHTKSKLMFYAKTLISDRAHEVSVMSFEESPAGVKNETNMQTHELVDQELEGCEEC